MSFSDDDLTRLKKEMPLVNTYGRLLTVSETGPGFDLEALLARLEAAEKVISRCKKPEMNGTSAIDLALFEFAYEAWRKAAGK